MKTQFGLALLAVAVLVPAMRSHAPRDRRNSSRATSASAIRTKIHNSGPGSSGAKSIDQLMYASIAPAVREGLAREPDRLCSYRLARA